MNKHRVALEKAMDLPGNFVDENIAGTMYPAVRAEEITDNVFEAKQILARIGEVNAQTLLDELRALPERVVYSGLNLVVDRLVGFKLTNRQRYGLLLLAGKFPEVPDLPSRLK